MHCKYTFCCIFPRLNILIYQLVDMNTSILLVESQVILNRITGFKSKNILKCAFKTKTSKTQCARCVWRAFVSKALPQTGNTVPQGFQLLGIVWREKHRARSARTHEWGPGQPGSWWGPRAKPMTGVQSSAPLCKKICIWRVKCTISGPCVVCKYLGACNMGTARGKRPLA